MNTAARISLYGAALAVAFTGAFALGSAAGPLTDRTAPAAHHAAARTGGTAGSPGEGTAQGTRTPPPPGGLQVSQDGYALALQTPRLTAGRQESLRFTIKDGAGRPVTGYRTSHDRELHLIVASRDLNTFRHLHPTRAADGTWSTPLDLPTAGDHRVFADFTPAGEGAPSLTLGADLAVAGPYEPRDLPAPDATARTEDGYTVTLNGGLTPGRAGKLTLSVAKDGRPVTDLEPYLGSYGHLVALRAGDLAYLHVHPEGTPGDPATAPGPAVSFSATAPTAGTYRLFLDFKHQGTVRTAAFTLPTTGGPTTPTATGPTTDDSGAGSGAGSDHGGDGHGDTH
ncbi:hypothetical protein [Streptomyces sp. NPDC089799]|uniref:hypothetical protein n=1 Tax=Streptomyces sp. NPDC089799 TaxID=3155066 RepID=UPI00343C3443